MSDMTPKQLAEAAHAFLEGDFGQHFITSLSLAYNGFHQRAEREELSIEQKALLVERAAGVKYAIDWLTQKDQLHQTGYYSKEQPAKQE